MKLYNKERKSEEIAETPNRVGNSTCSQGKDKRGKSAETNSFEALSNKDDDNEEERARAEQEERERWSHRQDNATINH